MSKLLAKVSEIADRIILVDDGSTDESAQMVLCWGSLPKVRLVRLPTNQGKSRALVVGLHRAARMLQEESLDPRSPLVLLDGDGQHPVDALLSFCSAFQSRSLDLLVARREGLAYAGLGRAWARQLITRQARWLTGVPYRDSLCGLRVLHLGRASELALNLRGSRYTCEQEMCIGLPLRGWKVANDFAIRVTHHRSNPTFRDALVILLTGFSIWIRVLCGSLLERLRGARHHEPLSAP